MPIPTTPSYYMEGTDALGSTNVESEQRALQLAIEYSMLGLTSEEDPANTFDELRVKKSVNMTECVAVPSSEHVAEIVGRQGMDEVSRCFKLPRAWQSTTSTLADLIKTTKTRS